MNATQKHLLKLLLEIDEICKKYDIEYFIDYGTTLGAVRHEGFIPWDDDVDITMTEENYYKWVEACEKELDTSKRVYSDGRLDREFPTVFGRYNDIETARVGQRSEFWKPICGQCIDVFYLLELPGDPVKKQKAIDRYFAYDEYSNCSYRHYRMKTESWMKLYRRYNFWGKIIGKERVLRRLEKKIFHQHYEDCDTYIATSARKKGPSSIAPKECYDTVYMADFEGHKLPIAGKYVELLNVYYEDTYCMLPEHKKGHSKMSHTGIGCADYVADYMRYIDKDEMLRERQRFKDIAVEEGYRTTRWSKAFYEKLGYCEALKMRRKLSEKGVSLRDCLDPTDAKKLAILEELFAGYYKKQMDTSVRAWEVYFEIGDDFLYAALFNLIYNRNEYYTVAKILKLRELNGEPLTSELEEIWDIIRTTRRAKAAIIYKKYDEAREHIKYGLKRYPHCREMQICDLQIDVLEAQDEAQYQLCENKAQTLLGQYAEDDQCIKALGDIAYARGDIPQAKKHYDWVMEKSINGMLHLDIKKKMGAQ